MCERCAHTCPHKCQKRRPKPNPRILVELFALFFAIPLGLMTVLSFVKVEKEKAILANILSEANFRLAKALNNVLGSK